MTRTQSSIRNFARCLAVACGVALSTGAAIAQNFAEHLPAPPFNLGGGTSLNSMFNGREYRVGNVIHNGIRIGEIRFSYANWSGRTDGGRVGAPDTGGAALAGGFYANLNPNVVPKMENGKLAWIQVVQPDIAGTGNVWRAPNGSAYPDTTNTLSPKYPHQSLPGGLAPAPAPAPDAAFQDFPNRFPTGMNQFWRAELGLALMDNLNREARIIGTFAWGFQIDAAGRLHRMWPGNWGAPSQAYMRTLEDAFSGPTSRGLNGVQGTAWDINQRPAYNLIPTPATAGLLAMAGLAAYRRRRAA